MFHCEINSIFQRVFRKLIPTIRTHVAKNSSGSESRVSDFLSCSPSKIPIKGVVLLATEFLEIWLLGANANDLDARTAIVTTSSVLRNRVDVIV